MQNIKSKFNLIEPKHKKLPIGYLLIMAIILISAVSLYFILNSCLKNALAEESLTSGNDYLTLTASGGDVDVTCTFDINPNNNIYFSKDKGGTWNLCDSNPYKLENGKSIQFKCQSVPNSTTYSSLASFAFASENVNAFIECGGSIMSIVDGTGLTTQIPNNCTFKSLFQNCKLLKSAPKLPATQLQESCYETMFSGCEQLQNAPDLPALEVPNSAYYSMFYACSSIVNPPQINAKKLNDRSCTSMFTNCTNLTKTSVFYFTEIDEMACTLMYQNCSNLKSASDLYPKILPHEAYAYMFQNCRSLEKAPEIFGETYGEECCLNMFEMGFTDPSNLTYSPDLHCKTLAKSSCEAMFEFCEKLQNCPNVPATQIDEACCKMMFYGCSSVVNGPELMATELYKECYKNMFGNCTQLKYIKVGFDTWPTEQDALFEWVYGVATSPKDNPGIFDAPEKLPWYYSYNYIPTNWINAVNADVEVYDGDYDGKPHCAVKNISVTKPANPNNPCKIAYSLDGQTWFEDVSKLENTEIGNYEFYVKVTSDQQFDPDPSYGSNEVRKQFADFNNKFVSTIKPGYPVTPEEENVIAGTSAQTGDNILIPIIVFLMIGLITISGFIVYRHIKK